jgi:hypothetical protein
MYMICTSISNVYFCISSDEKIMFLWFHHNWSKTTFYTYIKVFMTCIFLDLYVLKWIFFSVPVKRFHPKTPFLCMALVVAMFVPVRPPIRKCRLLCRLIRIILSGADRWYFSRNINKRDPNDEIFFFHHKMSSRVNENGQ